MPLSCGRGIKEKKDEEKTGVRGMVFLHKRERERDRRGFEREKEDWRERERDKRIRETKNTYRRVRLVVAKLDLFLALEAQGLSTDVFFMPVSIRRQGEVVART